MVIKMDCLEFLLVLVDVILSSYMFVCIGNHMSIFLQEYYSILFSETTSKAQLVHNASLTNCCCVLDLRLLVFIYFIDGPTNW